MADNEKNVTETVTEKEAEVKASEKKEAKVSKASKPTKKNKVSFWSKVKKAFKEFKAEFKKIVWSSRRNTFNNTVLVIVSMVVVSVVIGTLDTGFSKLLTLLGSLV